MFFVFKTSLVQTLCIHQTQVIEEKGKQGILFWYSSFKHCQRCQKMNTLSY